MRRSVLLALVALMGIVAGCGTATLLPDGRVLLLGIVAKAWDPATWTVVNLAMPPTMRVLGSATLLDNGLVLVAGGISPGGSSNTVLATAEVYDPATDTYTLTGSMAHPRLYHTATRLADGLVLMVGGMSDEDLLGMQGSADALHVLSAPEIYDPETATFGPAGGDTLIPHIVHTATLLQDGRVLIAGGETIPTPTDGASPDTVGSSTEPSARAELYDPWTGTFSATGSMTSPRTWHTATEFADARVLMVGGTVEMN